MRRIQGKAVVDAVMTTLCVGLLLFAPVTDRARWLPWAAAAATGLASGVAAAWVSRPPEGWRGFSAVGLAVAPMLLIASIAGAALGFSCIVGHSLGAVAGRARFPV